MATTRTATKAFYPARLRLARAYRGLTQTELGEAVNVTHQFVAYLEGGHREMVPTLASALGDTLGFAPGFFFRPLAEEIRDDECYFRRRQSTPVGVRSQVLAHATLFSELVSYLEQQVHLPMQSLPTLRVKTREDVERAAERSRMEWGLGLDLPIKSATRVLENAGVPVTRFEGLSQKVDAFSRFGKRSVVVLNDKTPSRSRWDIAHEWGHLLMHAGTLADAALAEDQANHFAGAFLLPRAGFMREFPRTKYNLAWDALFRLKKRWRTSVSAMVRRAFELHLIDATQYRRAYKYMSAQGWLKHEPAEFDCEEPELVRLAIGVVEKSFGTRPQMIAADLDWKATTFSAVGGVESAVEQLDAEPSPAPGKVVSLARMRARQRQRVH
jgi:Zn-dependent peptidase ImmA (M78 family)/transcriptional regulator with XRE-family HTH domain